MRTSINIPDDLKARMDKVEEQISWSRVACDAFEVKLGELAGKKKEKAMQDVVQRLRASKIETASEDQKSGYEAGAAWARNEAEFRMLKALAGAATDEYETYQEHYERGEWSIGNTLFFLMCPEHNEDHTTAREYWEDIVGFNCNQQNEFDFMMGFIEGARAVWVEVEPEL